MQDLFWKRVGTKKAPRWQKSGKDKNKESMKGSMSNASNSLDNSSSSESSSVEAVSELEKPEESAQEPEESLQQPDLPSLPSLPSKPWFPVDRVGHKPLLPERDMEIDVMAGDRSPSVATTVEDLPDEDVYLPDLGMVRWPDPNEGPPGPVNFAHLLPTQDVLLGPADLPSPPKSPCSLCPESLEGASETLKDLDAFLETFDTNPVPPCAAAEMDHLEGNNLAFEETLVEKNAQEMTGSQAMFSFCMAFECEMLRSFGTKEYK